MRLAEPAHCEDLRMVTFEVVLLGHQRDFTVVIAKADPQKTIVGNPLVEGQQVKISLINAALRELSVETRNQALVFGTNGANVHLSAVLKAPRFDTLNRIWTDGRQRRVD